MTRVRFAGERWDVASHSFFIMQPTSRKSLKKFKVWNVFYYWCRHRALEPVSTRASSGRSLAPILSRSFYFQPFSCICIFHFHLFSFITGVDTGLQNRCRHRLHSGLKIFQRPFSKRAFKTSHIYNLKKAGFHFTVLLEY